MLTVLSAVVAVAIVLVTGVEAPGSLATGIVGVVIVIVALEAIVDINGAAFPAVWLYPTVLVGLGLVVAGI